MNLHTSQGSSKSRQLSPVDATWRMAELCAWQLANLTAEQGYLPRFIAAAAELTTPKNSGQDLLWNGLTVGDKFCQILQRDHHQYIFVRMFH